MNNSWQGKLTAIEPVDEKYAVELVLLFLFRGRSYNTYGTGITNCYGGTVTSHMTSEKEGVLNIYGGDIGATLHLRNGGTINVYVSSLVLDGSRVSGLLLDGSPISVGASGIGEGTLNLHNVPEPSSMLLLAIGGMGLLIAGRRRR